MRTKFFNALAVFAAMVVFVGCSGDDEVAPPGAVTLVSPTGDNVCIKASGGASATTADVSFAWKGVSGADDYRVDITNLNTNTLATKVVTGINYKATLDVNAYYSWSVTASNSGGSSASEVYNFYLSGTPSSNYAPFAASLVFPAMDAVLSANGQSTLSVDFQWLGTDLDNDIAGYVFYLDQTNASTQVGSLITLSSVTQSLQSGKTYFWKVVTTDVAGNSSTSAVSSFSIQ